MPGRLTNLDRREMFYHEVLLQDFRFMNDRIANFNQLKHPGISLLQ